MTTKDTEAKEAEVEVEEQNVEVEEQNVEVPDNTPLELWTWGLSGQPSTWATSTWVRAIDTIRAANRGAADASAVQDALDDTFPDAGYVAADVMLAHPPVGEFTVTVGENSNGVHVELAGDEDLLLPDENVEWDFGDGTIVNDSGPVDHDYAAQGEHSVILSILVAGNRYGSGQTVTIGEAEAAGLMAADDDDELEDEDEEDEDEELEGEYDPAEHTVDEVLAYVADNPDEADRIVEAEEAGKGRVGILDKL